MLPYRCAGGAAIVKEGEPAGMILPWRRYKMRGEQGHTLLFRSPKHPYVSKYLST